MNATQIDAIRAGIPALRGRAYLNYGGAGTMPQSVLDAIAASFDRQQAVGPFSAEGLLWAESELGETKAAIAALLDSSPESILLTESVSAAASTVLWGLKWIPGDEIIVTDCENPSIVAAATSVAERFSLTIRELPVRGFDEAAILSRLEHVLNRRSRILIASHVSWIDGQVLPLHTMAALLRDQCPQAAVLADGAQAVGCIDAGPGRLGCDFYMFTAAKWICGPEGCAGVCISPAWCARLQPSHSGARAIRYTDTALEWHAGIRKLESGTKPVALLAGFREALRFHPAAAALADRTGRTELLSNLLRRELAGFAVPGGAAGIVSFRAPSALASSDARALVHFLEARDVLIREIPGRNLWRVCVHYFSIEDEILRCGALLSEYLDRCLSGGRLCRI